MRKIKECLRLRWECGLSLERVALALGVSKGVVAKYVARAEALGLDWAAVSALGESEVSTRLGAVSGRPRGQRALPDWGAVHRDLRRKDMTLQLLWQEYQEAHAGEATYQYTQFCEHYRAYAGTRSTGQYATLNVGESSGRVWRRS